MVIVGKGGGGGGGGGNHMCWAPGEGGGEKGRVLTDTLGIGKMGENSVSSCLYCHIGLPPCKGPNFYLHEHTPPHTPHPTPSPPPNPQHHPGVEGGVSPLARPGCVSSVTVVTHCRGQGVG